MKLATTRALLLLGLVTILGGCTAARFVKWNFANITDNKKFESLPLAPAAQPFQWLEGATGYPEKFDKTMVGPAGKQRSLPEFLEDEHSVAFLVIRNDSILYERYFNGYDTTRAVASFSMAKSFTSALVGIAVAEGKIKSAQDPITQYLPELQANPGLEKVTIEHLLNMRSGLHISESYVNPFGTAAKIYYGRNLARYITQWPTRIPPDSVFEYRSGDTQLLAMATARATGTQLTTYMQQKLWTPLGMEYPASWSVDKLGDAPVEKAFCCINSVARDYAKFGRLYLKGGNWQGQQLIPADWVRSSTTIDASSKDFWYSYQWWHTQKYTYSKTAADSLKGLGIPYSLETIKRKTDKLKPGQQPNGTQFVRYPAGDFFANGLLGQFIYVYPSKNIIIVRLGKKEGGVNWPIFMRGVAEALK